MEGKVSEKVALKEAWSLIMGSATDSNHVHILYMHTSQDCHWGVHDQSLVPLACEEYQLCDRQTKQSINQASAQADLANKQQPFRKTLSFTIKG